MTEKKSKKSAKTNPLKSKSGGQEKSAPAPAPVQESVIGILGWNSPRFAESHAAFLDHLRQAIARHQQKCAFYGISGGADSLWRAQTNGAQNRALSDKGAALLKRGFGFASRDLIADQIEILTHEENLSALVMVPWSISSFIGMMMASVRSNLPTIFLPYYAGWPSFQSPVSAAGKKDDVLTQLTYSRCSIVLLAEALGVARVGTFERLFAKKAVPSVPAVPGLPTEDQESVDWAARRILEMAKQSVSPRRFFTAASLHNAICVDLALGSSPETVLHLTALAAEAGHPLPLGAFNDSARRMPLLAPMSREGELPMEEFAKAGGLLGLLGALHAHLQPSPTVMGRNLMEVAREHESNRSVFKMMAAHPKPAGLAILAGNLAREGAVFRTAGLKEEKLSGFGPCKVFDGEQACLEAIASKKIKKGDVIVVRYMGPRGCPGMPVLDSVQEALQKHNLDDQVAILTDGRLNWTGRTPCFVQAAPEAAVGSTLSVLQTGDVILWDAHQKNLLARLTDTEIKVRLSRWKEQEKNLRNSFLYRYAKYASSTSTGALLV